MAKRALHPADLHDFSRMTSDAVAGLIDLVEATQRGAGARPPTGAPGPGGVAGRVYDRLRRVTRLVGGGMEALLAGFGRRVVGMPSSPERETMLAVLNGVLGDYLEASGSAQAIRMSFRRGGQPLEPETLADRGRLLVLAHGLCMHDLQWNRHGHDHGAALERDLGCAALYLHYNSGRHISSNGRDFAEALETLLAAWPAPVESLVILGFSMGGLLARSAWHCGVAAGHRWPALLRKLVFLATPHGGAPLERAGHWLDLTLGASPYTEPLARLGRIRSAGITDLRHACLLEEDWLGRDRFQTSALPQVLPLPEGVACYAMAATTGRQEGDFRDRWLGDGLVPLASALGRQEDPARSLAFPAERCWIGHQMNHLDLLARPEVYEILRQWVAED